MSRVPPHPSGGKDLPDVAEVEQLEELGDDAIIAHQQGAHAPKPRAQVTEEARSVVISDHPPVGSSPPPARAVGQPSPKRRSERTEKTVVIRDRREIDKLRRELAKRGSSSYPPASASPGLWVWVVVGVAAFVMGGLVALFATRDDEQASTPPPAASSAPFASSAPAATSEPPKVSIDELPVEDPRK